MPVFIVHPATIFKMETVQPEYDRQITPIH
jgi:hypothetical protein